MEWERKSSTAANALTTKERFSDADQRTYLKIERIIGEILKS